MSYVPTSRKAYKKHKYSGPRKSMKRVRGGLRQFYGEESRLKIWRSEENKKPVNEDIVIENSIVIQNKQLRTYERVKPKICLEDTTYSAPSASTVKVEPLEINWLQADPEPDTFQLTVESTPNICLSGISGYHTVHFRTKANDPLYIDEAQLRVQCENQLAEFQNSP